MLANFWTFSIGDLISALGLLVVCWRIIANHLFHLEERLSARILEVKVALDKHIEYHLEHKP